MNKTNYDIKSYVYGLKITDPTNNVDYKLYNTAIKNFTETNTSDMVKNNNRFDFTIVPNISSPDYNIFTYDEAENICRSYDGELATLEQVIDAYKNGANWCNYGWIKGNMAVFQTKKEAFDNLIKDVKKGLKRKIYSRRDNTTIEVEEFDALAKKYFKEIKDNHNFKFNFQSRDKNILVFILRWYYHLWIKIDDNSIEILHSFPKKFKIVKEVNKSNHFHTPKTFKTGTIMYFNSSAYSI